MPTWRVIHGVMLDEATILEIESNRKNRKYKD
jgi:hypothetical protein